MTNNPRTRRVSRLRVAATAAVLTCLFTPHVSAAMRVRQQAAQPATNNAVAEMMWPIDAPISHSFHLPNGHYGAGNRGIAFHVPTMTPVVAIHAGVVTFSGVVARRQFVTTQSGDDPITEFRYSYLAQRGVANGDTVVAGDVIGYAINEFHFGIVSNGEYVNPELLLSPRGLHAVLVASHS